MGDDSRYRLDDRSMYGSSSASSSRCSLLADAVAADETRELLNYDFDAVEVFVSLSSLS